jgi:DNA modification methylase
MQRLTEQEQQEIIRFIETGKPLPDKYRFLLFDDKREVELVWNGKTSEVCNIVLPFQVIEQVDEPRTEKPEKQELQTDLFSMDARGRQLKGWTNKLIWGDNKLILSSLKNGPLREEIEKQGGIKLVAIDPPFDVGADFSMDIEIGDDTFTKNPNILEEIAYRDTWGNGADSFIAMIYERLMLMRDLLAEDGSIYVHMGPTVNHYIRAVLDEIFGRENYSNEIIWRRSFGHNDSAKYGIIHDVIFYYCKSKKNIWNQLLQPADKEYIDTFFDQYDEKRKERYQRLSLSAGGLSGGGYRYEYKGVDTLWRCPIETLKKHDSEDRLHWPKKEGGVPRLKKYESEHEGVPLQDIWSDINKIHNQSNQLTGYSTQKPEALLERIIRASSNPGDLVADFFCGSGTTAAVAEKLGRKWIATDLGKFAIHTTRKRLIGVQRELKTAGKDYRAFEILNLGKYERQHYIGINPNLRQAEQQKQLEAKEAAFLDLILRAYRAEKTTGFACFHGKKAGRLVSVGPVNLPVTRLFVEEIILECRKKHITKVDILGFEFEMGLFPNVLDEARAKGIDIAPKYIPAEVFDKRAVEKNQVVFHDVSYIEVKPHVKGNTVAVELTDFSVFYSQDSIAHAEAAIKAKGNRIVVEKGQIVKVSKDKDGIVTREVLTKNWTDWIDYWSVDFDFESKREIIRVAKNEVGGHVQTELPGMGDGQLHLQEWEEVWTGDYIFENEWQSFRTKKDRSLELKSIFLECKPGRRKIAVKVVDIFGNDTMTIVEVSVGKNGGGKK